MFILAQWQQMFHIHYLHIALPYNSRSLINIYLHPTHILQDLWSFAVLTSNGTMPKIINLIQICIQHQAVHPGSSYIFMPWAFRTQILSQLTLYIHIIDSMQNLCLEFIIIQWLAIDHIDIQHHSINTGLEDGEYHSIFALIKTLK